MLEWWEYGMRGHNKVWIPFSPFTYPNKKITYTFYACYFAYEKETPMFIWQVPNVMGTKWDKFSHGVFTQNVPNATNKAFLFPESWLLNIYPLESWLTGFNMASLNVCRLVLAPGWGTLVWVHMTSHAPEINLTSFSGSFDATLQEDRSRSCHLS